MARIGMNMTNNRKQKDTDALLSKIKKLCTGDENKPVNTVMKDKLMEALSNVTHKPPNCS